MLKRIWNWLRRAPKVEPFNPVKWRGTKWVTLRATSTGQYAEIGYEYARTEKGLVLVVPAYLWDEEKGDWKHPAHRGTYDKQLSELLTEQEAAERLVLDLNWHPVTRMICRHKT